MGKNALEEIVAIEFINHERNIINFVKDENRFGFFNYNPTQIKPRIGDLLKVSFAPKSKDDKFFKVLKLQMASANDSCSAVRTFRGKISISNKNGFGFVDDILIFPQLVKKFKLVNEHEVSGKAVLSFDKKKESWGWKVFWLEV